MKTCFLVSKSDVGGATVYVHNLVKSLQGTHNTSFNNYIITDLIFQFNFYPLLIYVANPKSIILNLYNIN